MATLITPISVDGQTYCCDPATRHTEALLTGDVNEYDPDAWELFHAYPNQAGSGTVKFGICCASELELEVSGRMEKYNSGYDWIRVKLNGDEVFHRASVGTNNETEYETTGPIQVIITLGERACGHVIEIIGSTGDTLYNNDVWWRAKIVEIR